MRILLLASAALAFATPAAAQVRVFSENFDSAKPGNFGAGSTVGNFHVDDGDIDVVGDLNGSFFGCPNGAGNNCVDLNGNNPGTISTMVNLIAGNLYHVSFDIAGNGPRSVDYEIVAGLGNSPLFRFTASPLSPFRTVGFDYTATTTGAAALTFQSLNLDSPRYWGMIVDTVAVDNMSVRSAVPEPAAWCMMILGVGAIGFAMRRSRQTAAPLGAIG